MHSTLTSKQTDPHDIFVIDPDIVQVARADSFAVAHDAISHLSAQQAQAESAVAAGAAPPSVDTTFRATDVNHIQDNVRRRSGRPSSGSRWAARALFGFVFAIGSAVTAAAWQHYGDTAKQMIAEFVPQVAVTSPAPAEKLDVAAPVGSPAVPASAADQAISATDQQSAQPSPPAPSAPDVAVSVPPAAPDVAATPPESATMQSMAHDLATMTQQVEQLKARIEQLKAGQDQMSRDIAKNSETRNSETKNTAARIPEPNPRPRIAAVSTAAPRPAALPMRKPKPPLAAQVAAPISPPPAATAMPPPPESPVQAREPDGEPVLRPPMPVR